MLSLRTKDTQVFEETFISDYENSKDKVKYFFKEIEKIKLRPGFKGFFSCETPDYLKFEEEMSEKFDFLPKPTEKKFAGEYKGVTFYVELKGNLITLSVYWDEELPEEKHPFNNVEEFNEFKKNILE